MNKIKIYTVFIISLFFHHNNIFAQDNPSKENETIENSQSSFSLSLEYRPRTELRRGYQALPADTSKVAFLTSHRARLNLDYRRENFLLHTTLQDIRIWGDTDTRDATGKVQFYEFYVEPFVTDEFSIRVGRQRIAYDNQSLFAENNWRQAGGQHDAVRLMYRGNKLEGDLIGAYNQNEDQLFGTTYDIAWDFYKVLVANFLKYQINENITITGINFLDGYADPATNNETTHFKYTNGGRIAFEKNNLYLTFAGYYQHGKIETGEKHQAFFFEPELKWQAMPNYSLNLGTQILSGDNNPADGISTSFLAQYRAFHRHNGRMDYTAGTVSTNNHEGVIDHFLTQDINVTDKFRITWESHYLGTQKSLSVTENGATRSLDKFYGWENDFRFRYRANDFTNIELAYLFMIPGETLEYLPMGQIGSVNNVPQFAYVSVSWTPVLLNL